MEHHGGPWRVMKGHEGHGTTWRAMEGHRRLRRAKMFFLQLKWTKEDRAFTGGRNYFV
jgi:hypothetical protein